MTFEPDNFPYYAHFLLRTYNWMFSPLLQKCLEFYSWYFSTHKPDARLYSSSDLRAMAESLEKFRRDNKIEDLVEWIGHQPIPDAVGVRDAIQRRIGQAQQEPHMLPGHPDGAVEAVRFCLLELANEIDGQT
jgi:hypothetical protein